MVDGWLGEKIGGYLRENGMSQTFLSIKTGIELKKLNLSINGRRRFSFTEYELICGVLGVDTNYFIKPRTPEKGG